FRSQITPEPRRFDYLIAPFVSEFISDLHPLLLRVLEKALASASGDASVQFGLIGRTLQLTSLLIDSTKRCFRKRASAHNSNSWLLPPELTIKVFSKLETKDLMQAMVSCTMFQKCAKEPLAYSHINLTTRIVDDGDVRTMIHRAGKEIRSLELGHAGRSDKSARELLKGSYLAPLSHNHGYIGYCLDISVSNLLYLSMQFDGL
ncbi:hypothetical protein EUTSA_v10029301mg, partial [Eutrema salsugineum]